MYIAINKNVETLTTIWSDTKETISPDFFEPLTVEKLDNVDFQEIICNSIEHSTKPKCEI